MSGKTSVSKAKKLATAATGLIIGCMTAVAGNTDSASVAKEYIEKLAATQKYEHRLQRREATWRKLIPEMFTLQYAGDIGMLSAGLGWAYGKGDRWETHLLFGFLPKRYNYHHYWTFTLREVFNPWRLDFKKQYHVVPLSVNLSLNSILHSDFWMKEPSRYPNGYYGFSSRMRFHLGFGSRFCISIPRHKRFLSREVAVYYEISTCDLYVRQKLLNSNIPLKDIIAIGIGVIYTI
ncbi:MAG: hypothetical protein K2O12_01200 [Muribaculaceae bacterium]|nr:hypothetical protein [Muribaculaceae bacterium]